MDFLTALEARSLESRGQQSRAPSEPFLAPSLPLPSLWWWLTGLGVPGLVAATPQSLPLVLSHDILPSCVCVSMSLLVSAYLS